jgi:signal-transduction protein with cAMP-binding, CBS, and nucleotidyltransferase domain
MERDARGLSPMPVVAMGLPPPVWLDDHATMQDVARMMMGEGVSAVIVGGDAAIVTERDIVCALARGEAPDTPAADVATHDSIRFPDRGAAVSALAEMLHTGVRHLVVVDDAGLPCAVLSLGAAAAFVLDAAPVPTWVSALRVVLRVDDV